MADVTINELTRGTPLGNNIVPYSTGPNTLGVPVSAILQNAGNIGIGTTNPTLGRLQVGTIYGVETLGGNGSIKIHYAIDCSPRVELNQSIPGGVGGPSGAGIGFALGSPNQYDALAVRGSAIAVPDPNTDRTLCFYTSDTVKLAERMRIDANGRVGIGTANPTARLDVNGDVRATSYKTGSLPMFGANAFVHFHGGQDINGNASTANTERRIYAGGNVSSVLRNALGLYTIYFNTAMTSTEYLAVCSARHLDGTTWDVHCECSNRLTTSCVVNVQSNYAGSPGSTAYDSRDVDVMIIC